MDPDPAAPADVAILGGSFDPVHAGHLHAARAACEARAIRRVLFVPAARPPHKPGRRLADARHRVAMLELALADEPGWSVWTGELEREGPSYTIDTVRELAREGIARPWLILGDDNLADLASWREVEALLDAVRPLVVLRSTGAREALEAAAARLPAALAARLREGLVAAPPVEVSATELRGRLARGEDPGELLPPRVADYVREHGLYREA